MSERFWQAVAWLMPRRLVYWCVVRAAAHASTTTLQDTPVPAITVVDTMGAYQ